MRAFIAACVLCCAVPAHAQSLKTATYVFAASAAADWTATYHFLDVGAATETNPLLGPMHNQPGATVALGAALDVVTVWAWNRYVGRTHPRIAAWGLLGMSAYRFDLARRGVQVVGASRRPLP